MNAPARVFLALLLVAGAPASSAAQEPERDAPDATDPVPLYSDLGDHHYEITARQSLVQDYFDQGLRLYYAFNHAEAIRSFRAAQAIDPDCAMCWWGEALAWGPNINLAMDAPSGVQAFRAVQKAVALKELASPLEQALIDALAVRYEATPPDDRAHLDRAYADAMGALARRYPDDQEVRALHAESLLDLRPWDYWNERGEPQPGIDEALAGLDHVLETNENHPGACHFYIHTVEKLYPERAVPCAERLAGLMPGAGHIVHMPGHIYIRVGRYVEAVEANEHAVHADETFIRDQRPGLGMYTAGYYPHNYDFMAFAAMMIGRSEQALEAADKVGTLLPQELYGAPGMDFLQHWSVRPLLFRVRFERWDEVLETVAPPDTRPHSQSIWHYARGRAFAAQGDAASATEELEQLRASAERAAADGLKMEFNLSSDLLAIAERVLSGWIDVAAGRYGQAVEALREAVRLEDALLYGEPPEWTVPARQELGAVLLSAGRSAEAETVFREDLDLFPRNGWSLQGLSVALREQGRTAEAQAAERDLRAVWEGADVGLPEPIRR